MQHGIVFGTLLVEKVMHSKVWWIKDPVSCKTSVDVEQILAHHTYLWSFLDVCFMPHICMYVQYITYLHFLVFSYWIHSCLARLFYCTFRSYLHKMIFIHLFTYFSLRLNALLLNWCCCCCFLFFVVSCCDLLLSLFSLPVEIIKVLHLFSYLRVANNDNVILYFSCDTISKAQHLVLIENKRWRSSQIK